MDISVYQECHFPALVNLVLFLCTIIMFVIYGISVFRFKNEQEEKKWTTRVAPFLAILFMAWLLVMCSGGLSID